MKRKHCASNRSYADKEDGSGAAANQPSKEVLGDLIWVSLRGSSWWPAQVFDDNAVSQRNKPKKRSTGEVLVRLYGSYKYMYVDPMKYLTEFENILEQNNGNHSQIFKKALDQHLARLRSDEEKAKKGSKSQEPTERRTKVMQRLGLVAPSGSPFIRKGHLNLNLSLCS